MCAFVDCLPGVWGRGKHRASFCQCVHVERESIGDGVVRSAYAVGLNNVSFPFSAFYVGILVVWC